MIIEHVHLSIKSGQSEAFLEAFEQAKHIVYQWKALMRSTD